MKYAVFIPSAGRPDKALKTVHNLQACCPVFVVCPASDTACYTDSLKGSDVAILSTPQTFPRGVAPARDFCISAAYNRGFECCVMLDDDVRFSKRQSVERYVALKESRCVVEDLADACSEASPIVCVKQRLFCNVIDKSRTIPIRAVAIHTPTFDRLGIKYAFAGPKTVMEDYYVALRCRVTHGLPWKCLDWYTVGDGGTQTCGGCSLWRDAAAHEISAKLLAQAFPECVKVYSKKGKIAESYLDVKFNWVWLNKNTPKTL